MPQVGDVFYRAHAQLSQTALSSGVEVNYEVLQITKVTQHGIWLVSTDWLVDPTADRTSPSGMLFDERPHWRRWQTVWAWPTWQEALTSLKRRSLRRYRYAEQRLDQARMVLEYLGVPVPVKTPILASSHWGINV